MADVKRSVVISPAQDRFLTELQERYGLNRSHGVRMALDKLMRDPPFFVSPCLSESKEKVDGQQATGVAS